ncbi:MAG TPA: hypothetical protein VK797_23420 [Tepidisphaeraceae bacterium]|nr:hypothetical protein [Tepidisphaeraceae bacterium]
MPFSPIVVDEELGEIECKQLRLAGERFVIVRGAIEATPSCCIVISSESMLDLEGGIVVVAEEPAERPALEFERLAFGVGHLQRRPAGDDGVKTVVDGGDGVMGDFRH